MPVCIAWSPKTIVIVVLLVNVFSDIIEIMSVHKALDA